MSRRIRTWLVAGVAAIDALCLPMVAIGQDEDPRCIALAALSRFTIISTKETNWRDLYVGADVTVGTTDVPGSCSLASNTCECPKLSCASEGMACSSNSDCGDGNCSAGVCRCPSVACGIRGRRCRGDADCLVAAPGRCNLAAHACDCPTRAASCAARGRACSSDEDCTVPASPLGASIGGLCGNDMRITAGSRMGLVATRGDVDFGALNKCRILHIESEFAKTPSGRVTTAAVAPFLGPLTRSAACAGDASCQGECVSGRHLAVGLTPFSSSDGQAHRGLAGSGSSLNFKLCDAALDLLAAKGTDRQFSPSDFQLAIENYTPLPSERVTLGGGNCLACAAPTTPDGGCAPCGGADIVRTRSRTQKLVLELGGGLQIVDLPRVALQGNSVLEIRGQRDTVAVLRVSKSLRLGGEAKIVLGSNGSGNGTLQVDKLLWVAKGRKGGRPNLGRACTFRGTLLASGRSGIRVGGAVLAEGGLWSRKVSVGVQSTVQHYPFSELLPLPGFESQPFARVTEELSNCANGLGAIDTPTSTPSESVTPTPTPSNTATPTDTHTHTPSATFTLTRSPTPSSTTVPTSTFTTVPSVTPSNTPVPSATATSSKAPTSTPTSTIRPTDTPSATATASASRSSTPAATSTSTATQSATATATATAAALPVMDGPDLAIRKFRVAAFSSQAAGFYFLEIKNVGSLTTNGEVRVTDIMPSGVQLQSVNGVGWDCTGSHETEVVCTRPGAVSPGTILPLLSISIFVTAPAGSTISNTGVVSTLGDSNPRNDRSTDTTFIHAPC